MNVLKTALLEIYGLFVEDGSFAIGIVCWLLIAAFVLPHLPLAGTWRACVFFVGLLLLLLENVQRSARKR